jgi:hypothetical protein
MADAAALRKCFASLPLSLALVIFALLPVDQRMRCAEVCRAWRNALAERSLWLRLDMSSEAGLARPATDALLRAAAVRAGGQMHSLDVSECEDITHPCLLAVLASNAGALRELHAWRRDFIELGDAEALLRAAPQLRVFEADVACSSVAEAQRLLRKEGAFAPLRLRELRFKQASTLKRRLLCCRWQKTWVRTPAWFLFLSSAHRCTRPLRWTRSWL